MNSSPKARLPVVFLAFFALFGCVGVAVLIFIWSPSDMSMDPPLIFKIVGSFIATMFMVMGFGVPLSAIKAARCADDAGSAPSAGPSPGGDAKAGGYRCPNCGAGLGPDQEVSPSGDAKCTYCKRWWNIHRAPA